MSVDKLAAAEHAGRYHDTLMKMGTAGAIPWVVVWQLVMLAAKYGWPLVATLVPIIMSPHMGGYSWHDLASWCEKAVAAEVAGLPVPPLPAPSTPPAPAFTLAP